MGVLLGGHAFDVSRDRLLPALQWTIATGVVLAVLEMGMSLVWLHQLRGLMTMAKIGLLFLVPCFWADRLWILMAVVVLASVGSHMPARFRYYSLLRREVIRDSCGPGTARFAEEFQGDGK
jgi:pheromone shutdown protein TraB